MSEDSTFEVLSLGAGVQSTTLLLMSLRGILPRLSAAVFADTRYEPQAVYDHLDWLETLCRAEGVPLHIVSAGDLREDALEFRQYRRIADGKRYASIPFFVRNPDGSQGRITRQCTSEYKIEPVEKFIKRTILGLAPRQHAPQTPRVRQWLGISQDESRRASYPGRMRKAKKEIKDLFGQPLQIETSVWKPQKWKTHLYPLLGVELTPDRKCLDSNLLSRQMARDDCLAWLEEHYPGRKIPRSACICCPFRSDSEWLEMREQDPTSWNDAVAFDYAIRLRDEAGLTDGAIQRIRKPLVGTIYTHRQMVPLDMVDLSNPDKSRGGCGSIFDGEPDGMCGN